MFRKYWWILVLMGILTLAVSGCDDSDGDDSDAAEVGTVISGKVAQTYVSGALVIADKVTGANGMGDFMTSVAGQDENGNFLPGEVYSYSDSEGNFSLTIPPGYGEYVLLSKGGTVRNSDGERVDALPMMAPMGARNITMITSLAVWAPSLKNKLGADYDVDVANRNGVPWQILQLAKTAEAYLSLWSRDDLLGFVPLSFKLEVLGYLANELDGDDVDIEKKSDIETAVSVAVWNIVNDDYGLSGIDVEWLTGLFIAATNGIIDAIPDSGDVVEADILANVELAVAPSLQSLQGNRLAFDPTASILPLPNDIAWSESQGRVYLPAPDDPQQAALFTAVNALELKGLSPNTLIAIPLENAKPVDEAALRTNIRLINYSTMLGLVYGALQLGNPMEATPDQIIAGIKAQIDAAPQETMGIIQQTIGANMDKIFAGPLKIIQEDNFIKIYPLRPLAAGSNYLAVILERACQGPCGAGDPGTLFTDINGIMVRAPQIYEFLKFEEPLVGDAAALEPLRQQYAPIYNDLLPMVGIDKDNTLEIFTFTTADKTLSVQDFGTLMTYLRQFVTGEGDMTLDDLAAAVSESANLPYAAITAEYDAIHASLPEATGVNVNADLEPTPGVLISIDIAASTPENPVRTTLEYAISNGAAYDPAEKAVVLYQHSWLWSKENLQYIVGPDGLPLPGIGIDLPFHGSRVNPGVPSGMEFFTTNLPQNRINLYQSYVDMTVLLRNLRAGLFNLDGDGAVFIPGVTDPDPDDVPNTIYFVGNSLGAITGSVFATYNIDALDRIVLNTGAANVATLFDSSPNLDDLVSGLGVERNSPEYFTTLGVLQLLTDPADPTNLVNPAIANKTLVQSAFGDQTTSNITNQVQTTVAGHPQVVPVSDFTAPLSAEPGWYMFGGEPDHYVTHEFLLWPRVGSDDDRFDANYVQAAYEAARDQVARFLGVGD